MPSLYYTHTRKVFQRDGQWLAAEDCIKRRPDEVVVEKEVRCRTIGDITCTGLTLSKAHSLEDIVAEIAATRVTERGGAPTTNEAKRRWKTARSRDIFRMKN